MSNQAPAILTINLHALAANYRKLEQASRGECAAVVKANGYGLGLEHVGQTLADAGCNEFFVANIDEGILLRDAIGAGPIIYVIGPVLAWNEGEFPRHQLIPVLNSVQDIAHWKKSGAGHPCVVHFDTGMNRLGLGADETAHVLADPTILEDLNIVLGMSHFASSEDLDDPLNDVQLVKFRDIKARLKLPRWSLCNTAAILRFGDDHYDLTRAGYGLYGGNPLPHMDNAMDNVVTLTARVLHTKKVTAGETVGYNATYRFDGDDEVAVIALGYADGFLRSQSSKGLVYWQGQACPIVGRVSMDLTTVRIGHLAQKPGIGDLIEVLGPHQGVDALAGRAGTNGYEILTRLGSRYHRHYIDAA